MAGPAQVAPHRNFERQLVTSLAPEELRNTAIIGNVASAAPNGEFRTTSRRGRDGVWMLKTLACALVLALATSEAISADWQPLPTPTDSPLVAAGFRHDDGGAFIVACDAKARLIFILIEEPRASWQEGATMPVTTRADDGTERKPASTGMIIGPTRLVIKEDSTWDLLTAGQAKAFFATGVGGYGRIWPVGDLKRATDSVLKACGGHW
jgi:hypothetical protein